MNHPTTLPAVHPEIANPQQGILPGLLALVRDYRAVPPERALYRELIRQVVGSSIESYLVGGYKISASTIKLVAWSLFGRMDAAGYLVGPDGRPFSRTVYATDASISTRACRAALSFLKTARLLSGDPAHGRQREVLRINPGGLTWTAVRKRVKVEVYRDQQDRRVDGASTLQESLPLPRKGDGASTLQNRRGDGASPLQGYIRTGQDRTRVPASSRGRAAVPRTGAEAAAQGRPAALDVAEILERDRRADTDAHATKMATRADEKIKIKTGLVNGLVGAGVGAATPDVAPPPPAVQNGFEYTDEMYREDEALYIARTTRRKATEQENKNHCTACDYPDPGTVCP